VVPARDHVKRKCAVYLIQQWPDVRALIGQLAHLEGQEIQSQQVEYYQ
jgi:hypothetical protein